jgi:Concanavalin A-like lectin/glucanases superfamily
VAVVVGASPETGHAAGTYLKPGMISQASGWLTLQTLNGVSVTLDAPFRAELLGYDRILLSEGRARVRVPDGAEGFRLDSPAFDVVDLGTEFAAVVNRDGTGTCRVFEGEADVSLLDSIGEVKRTRRVTANESLSVDPSKQDMRVIEEANSDYPEIKQPPRPLLALPVSYPAEVMAMAPVGYWRFEDIRDRVVTNEVAGGARLQAAGGADIAMESGGNHSGELMRRTQAEWFQIPDRVAPMVQGDFSVGLFVQFEWLQNFALISATCFDERIQGHSFILQSYASFRRSGFNGTGLHAVLRDPPAWDGGPEIYGNTRLRPLHWYHVAATREGGQLALYLDGVMVGSEAAGSMPLECHQIFVGRLNGNASQPRMEARGLVGHLDELAIFPRALTQSEIRRLALITK